jgi:myo-inositol-hexaphosphate 3-phosphohydrolase
MLKTLVALGMASALPALAAPALPTPAFLRGANAVRALQDGAWLALHKKSVRLIDARGQERARVALHGKHLDARPLVGGALAVVLDADTQRTMALLVDLKIMAFSASVAVESPAFKVEALCLYRDAQGLNQVFLVGSEGLSQQWVLGNAQAAQSARLVRNLALAPGAKSCAVDDADHRLRVQLESGGAWAYRADAEGKFTGGFVNATTKRNGKGAAMAEPPLPIVQARVQTESMARFGDVADDPAIWIHPNDASRSRVLGTNKKQGLLVYDLAGKQQQFLEVGRINNVDVRQRVRLGMHELDLAVATQRDDLSVVVFAIDADGQVRENSRIPTGLKDIYGICLYQPRTGGLEVFVNDKDGTYQRYALGHAEGKLTHALVQTFKVATQPEACVADDAAQRLFIGEEKRGVWVMSLAVSVQTAPKLLMAMPIGGLLHADTEGLALYHGQQGSYLVVSSQGNNSYVVADAAPPYRVRGAFRIGINLELGIDGASETDGLEVTSTALGAAFPQGMLVVQDGYKRLPNGAQNFKLVAWEDIAAALKLP